MAEIGEGGEQWFHECMTCRLTSREPRRLRSCLAKSWGSEK
jgi:hypothetical protein